MTDLIRINDLHVNFNVHGGMIEAVKSAAQAAGLPPGQVRFELFATPAPQVDDAAFEIELGSGGQVFTVPPGRSIIEVLEDEGIDVIYDCQRGDCGICQCDVIEGEPDHRDVILTDDEKASNTVMQICVSRAKTPKLVIDI